MYAIIDDGGKQLRVEEGQSVDLDYREAVTIGDELELNRVLAIAGENGLELGHPAVDGAK
ncbi:MAG: large ribosomal subunit protein bL21, partial [Planctomycetota bacterium]